MSKKKQPTNETPSVDQKDEALFEALGKSKKKKKRKIIRTILIIVLVLAIVLAAGVTILQRKVREEFAMGWYPESPMILSSWPVWAPSWQPCPM